MTKEIELYAVCQDTSEIGVYLNGFMKHTGLMVRQEQDGTKVWNRKSGKTVFDPKKHYTLSNEEGRQEFADDLDEMGLLGKHYYVRGSFQSAEWAEHKSIDLSGCYEDSFDVGDFLTDEEAIEAVEEIQSEHDEAACQMLKEEGFDDDLGGDGPCYAAHLYRSEEDEDVRVEL